MKVINFSVKEILPALLDKSKTQTIRKAWKDDSLKDMPKDKFMWKVAPARFKVGEKVKIMWNQRSKYQFFDSKGKGCNKQYSSFAKTLGVVEITEVFKITMVKYDVELNHFQVSHEGTSWDGGLYYLLKTLASLDGFDDVETMFRTFDKMYDLSTPKEFYVYRWRWLE